MTYRKKLIEVALPLDAINKESAREKSIRHGHPSTLFEEMQVVSIIVDRSLPSLRRRDAGPPRGGPSLLFSRSGDE